MSDIDRLLDESRVHDDWREPLGSALSRVEPAYLAALLEDESWLPGADRLLAAFRRRRAGLRFLLLGESPYPRCESANGIAFYDAAVGALWSEQGLSKAVNRATSLRNIIKTALIAEGRVKQDAQGKLSQQAITGVDKRGMVQTLAELFANLEAAGFLLLNATPVLHPARKPAVEARYWHEFLDCLLESIRQDTRPTPTLLLWGKIASLVEALPSSRGYQRLVCEHPYNLSFIDNPDVQRLFRALRVLRAPPPDGYARPNEFAAGPQTESSP